MAGSATAETQGAAVGGRFWRALRPTALEWFALVASVLLTLQYGWLLDDAFIYYRYVDNLLFLDRGLVFNEGEYVEGFSSPLWCLSLVPLRWIGLDWWLLTRVVGVACAAGTWALLVALRRRANPAGTGVLNFPLLYLAFNYAVQTYFTSGVETPLVQLCAVAFALHLVAPQLRVAQWLVGLAPMVRHELALPLVVVLAWDAWRARRIPWTPLLVCAATLGAWLAFRVVYYAELLPNTFYLKDEVNFARGWSYVHETCTVYGVYWLAPLFVLLALALVRAGVRIEGGARVVMFVCAALVTLYVAKIGGDPRHYRYLAFPFCLLACASAGLLEHAVARWLPRTRPAAWVAVGLAVSALSFSAYPRQLSKHPVGRDAEHVQIDGVNDAQYHRLEPDLSFSPWAFVTADEALDDRMLERIYKDSGMAYQGPSSVRDEYRRWRTAPQRATFQPVIADGWCVDIWKLFTHTVVHVNGLTDPVLARASTPSWRAAHKRELHPLARYLAALRAEFGSRRGTYRAAAETGLAKPWIAANLDTLELIERKAYNRHDLAENLVLAFQFPGTVEIRTEDGPQRPLRRK